MDRAGPETVDGADVVAVLAFAITHLHWGFWAFPLATVVIEVFTTANLLPPPLYFRNRGCKPDGFEKFLAA
jgi:hypothetical protein